MIQRWSLVLICLSLLCGTPESWPLELSVPNSGPSPDGPSLLYFSSEKSCEKAFRSTDYFLWTPVTKEDLDFEQSFYYEVYKDRYDISRQYIDMSGSIEKTVRKDALNLGVDWTPAMNAFRGRAAGGLLLTTDIGPNARVEYRGVPLYIRSGISAQSRADTLYTGSPLFSETINDPGFYGTFQLGDYKNPFMDYPVYIEGRGFVRSIDGTGMAVLTGSALTALELGSGDSVLFFYGDTLFNGKEGYIGESAEGVSLINTPWKIERNTRFTAGLRMEERMALSSAFWYSLGRNALKYPSDNRMWDGSVRRSSIGTQVHTDTAMNFGASVHFGIEWREYERRRSAANTDALDKSIMTDYNPNLNVSAFIAFPFKIKTRYDYNVSRTLTEYPQINKENTLTNDRDRLTSSHRLTFTAGQWSRFDAEIYGESTHYTLQYLQSHQSSRNRSDEGQRVGLLVSIKPLPVLELKEYAAAEAKRSDYHFREFYTEPQFTPPWYSRALSSATTVRWQLSERYNFKVGWDKRYSDYGHWYGQEYMVEELRVDSTLRTDYYAIVGKSMLHSIDMSVNYEKERFNAQLGTKAIEIHDKIWDRVYGTGKKGVIVEPYMETAAMIKDTFGIMLHLSNTLVIGQTGFLGESGVWDFKIMITGGF